MTIDKQTLLAQLDALDVVQLYRNSGYQSYQAVARSALTDWSTTDYPSVISPTEEILLRNEDGTYFMYSPFGDSHLVPVVVPAGTYLQDGRFMVGETDYGDALTYIADTVQNWQPDPALPTVRFFYPTYPQQEEEIYGGTDIPDPDDGALPGDTTNPPCDITPEKVIVVCRPIESPLVKFSAVVSALTLTLSLIAFIGTRRGKENGR